MFSALNITVSVPRLAIPGSPGSDDGEQKPHFIHDATVRTLFSLTMFHTETRRKDFLPTLTIIVLPLVFHRRLHSLLASNREQHPNHLNRRKGFL